MYRSKASSKNQNLIRIGWEKDGEEVSFFAQVIRKPFQSCPFLLENTFWKTNRDWVYSQESPKGLGRKGWMGESLS